MTNLIWILARAPGLPEQRNAAPALSTLALWLARSRSRHQLAELDDRGLADIGLDRATRARECAKHFWQP